MPFSKSKQPPFFPKASLLFLVLLPSLAASSSDALSLYKNDQVTTIESFLNHYNLRTLGQNLEISGYQQLSLKELLAMEERVLNNFCKHCGLQFAVKKRFKEAIQKEKHRKEQLLKGAYLFVGLEVAAGRGSSKELLASYHHLPKPTKQKKPLPTTDPKVLYYASTFSLQTFLASGLQKDLNQALQYARDLKKFCETKEDLHAAYLLLQKALFHKKKMESLAEVTDWLFDHHHAPQEEDAAIYQELAIHLLGKQEAGPIQQQRALLQKAKKYAEISYQLRKKKWGAEASITEATKKILDLSNDALHHLQKKESEKESTNCVIL